MTPGELSKALVGDLDAIVERALEASPGRGYPTVEDLASDVRRYLEGRSVSARKRTSREQALEALGKHLPLLATVGVLGVLGGVFLGRSSFEPSTSVAENVQLERFIGRLLEDADIADSGGRRVSARQLLDRGVQQVERSALPPAARSIELGILAGGYRQLGAYDRAVTVATQALAEARDGGAAALRLTELLVERAELELLAGLPAAVSSAEQAAAQAVDLDDEDLAAAADSVLGRTLLTEDPPRAAALLEAALPRLVNARAFESRLAYAKALQAADDPEGAAVVLQDAVASARTVPGSRLGRAKAALGDHSLANGRPTSASEYYTEAFDDYRAALGEAHWRIAEVQLALARSRVAEGRLEDALEASRKALSVARQVFGDRDARTELARAEFALRLFDLGESERAEALLSSVAAALQTQLDSGVDRETLAVLSGLGTVRHTLGRYQDAVSAFEQSAARASEATDADRAAVRVLLARSALALAEGGGRDAPLASLQTALTEPGLDPAARALGLATLARAQLDGGGEAASVETSSVLARAIEEALASAGPSSWKVAEARVELAALHLEAGDSAAAQKELDLAGAVLEGRGDVLAQRYEEVRRRLRG